MDAGARTHVAQTDDVPLAKIAGVLIVCFSLIAVMLYLGVQWILRVGKREHEEKIRKAQAVVVAASKKED
ncbi:hypothetical protein BGZ74_005177 [Mortierella antarctica]|nr:hypothetical protein BGZ74_005177 [Mortierella antarctica]KAG0356537.1 hypothetical protein BG005_004535 [Podila minutissima]